MSSSNTSPNLNDDRKSDFSKVSGVKPSASLGETLSSGASVGAFDGCTDFSKLNAGRHNAGRADTFNTPPSLIKPKQWHPSTPRSNSRQGINSLSGSGPTRELLEIFEMGIARTMANLRNEVREELQQGLDELRSEVLATVADARGHELLQQVVRNVDQIRTGPVKVDFSSVLEEVRLTHSSLRDAVRDATVSVLKQVSSSGAKLQEDLKATSEEDLRWQQEHSDSVLSRLDKILEELNTRLATSIDIGTSIHNLSGAISRNVDELTEQQRRHQETLDFSERQSNLRDRSAEAALTRLQADMSKLHIEHRSLCEAHQEHLEVSGVIKQECLSFGSSLLPSMRQQINTLFQANRISLDLGPVLTQVGRAQHMMTMHFPNLLSEIARVQEALGLDFMQALVPDHGKVLEPPQCAELMTAVTNMLGGVAQGKVQSQSDKKECSLFFSSVLPNVPQQTSANHVSVATSTPADAWAACEDQTGAAGLDCEMVALVSSDGGSGGGGSGGSGDSGGSGCGGGGGSSSSTAWEGRSLLSRSNGLKRVRHYWAQTQQEEKVDAAAQTDEVAHVPETVKIAKKKPESRPIAVAVPSKVLNVQRRRSQQVLKPVFADSETMKQRAREALIRPQYHVSDYYHEVGWARELALHSFFEYFTLAVIFANAVWMAIDADLNEAITWLDADPLFQIGENVFCVYFCFELTIRFLAFKHKRNCLKDSWFVFDSLLVLLMVLETWVVTFIMYVVGGGSNSTSISNISLFRMVRMVKMLRISRMARLMRGLPELFILIKGIKAASRSVFIFFVMWAFIIYVFSLVFRMTYDSVGSGTTVYFSSVPAIMNTLFLNGIMPGHAAFVKAIATESWFYWPVAVSFVALSFVLLMNMLIGVLVEVVNAIAITEREGITVSTLACDLRTSMTQMGFDPDRSLSKDEIEQVICDPEVALIVDQAGSDIVTLADMLNFVFDDLADEAGNISFGDLVDTILNLRGTNPAKVKDVKSQLRAIKVAVKDCEGAMRRAFQEEVQEMRLELDALRTDVLSMQEDGFSDGRQSVRSTFVARNDD